MPNLMEHIDEVVEWFAHGTRHEPYFVALDGHSAAGKSTLARALASVLPRCQVVAGDDFYRVMAPAQRLVLAAAEGCEQYFDWQRLAADVLRPLHAGRLTRYQAYDWDHNALGVWKSVVPEGVIVVEGVYSARPALAAYYDAVFCVEAPRERRWAVQRSRGDAWEWVERWEAAEVYYLRESGLRARADVVFAAR